MKTWFALFLSLAGIAILAFSPMPDKRIGGVMFSCTAILLYFMPEKQKP